MSCFMLKESEPQPLPHGNGQIIRVHRWAALGDVLASTVVADKLDALGYTVHYRSIGDCHCILRRVPSISAIYGEDGPAEVNLDKAYESHPLRRRLSFAEIYLQVANAQLARIGINLGNARNCKPSMHVTEHEKAAITSKFRHYPKPWVFICPRSSNWKNRTVNDGTWSAAAGRIQGTKFWLGRHPAPPNCIDLKANHVDNVILWLSVADLLVTVDTGPMHIAAALGVPILAIGQASSPELHLNDQTDFLTISPKLDCLNCQQNICPIPNRGDNPPCQEIDSELISRWANAKLQQVTTDNVSAVIPVYGSAPDVIKRCLECVLPQVNEVVITAETADKVPQGIPKDPKIMVVVKGQKGIGYARNCNFGARHTTGKNLLIMNDDVFLNPDWVQRAMAVMNPGVGCVAGKLWYQDGTLYHGGKFRNPGERGWGHIDLRATVGSVKEPMEVENVNGAALLVTRGAFYDINGFNENYFGYCSDDATCLSLRQKGWKIWYQPHAEGIHVEGQSFMKLELHRKELIKNGIRQFENDWGWWWDLNLHNVPGNNFG